MATRRSDDRGGWHATALLFSGRPNPDWWLTPEQGAALDHAWGTLPPLAEPPPEPPPLGYRGYVVEGPDGTRYEGRPGVVTRDGEQRADPDGAFEAAVMSSAPPGLL